MALSWCLDGVGSRLCSVLTTHYMEEAAALSDRVGIMKNGRLLTVGTVQELTDKAGKTDFEEAFVALIREERL